ncbi:hypothetical protein MHYP_G00178610 [Metynnis hypsauchen]
MRALFGSCELTLTLSSPLALFCLRSADPRSTRCYMGRPRRTGALGSGGMVEQTAAPPYAPVEWAQTRSYQEKKSSSELLFHLLLLRDVWSCESVALGLVKNHRDAARELKAGRWKRGPLGSPRAAPQGSSAEVRGDESSCNLLIFCLLSFHSADVYRGSRSAAKLERNIATQRRPPALQTALCELHLTTVPPRPD